jgi:dolichol-phosphate mannosyltransferase
MSPATPAAHRWGNVLVIVPTYNEIDSLERVLSHLLVTVPGVDALIVDDASPDGTGDLADRLAAADARIHVLHGTAKAGLGRAYLTGFTWAKDAGYDIVVEMDADGSHPAESLAAMLDQLTTATPAPGLVIGSRWMPGGSVVNWPAHRLWLSRGANFYARLALRIPVADITAGFRAYPIDVAIAAARDIDSRGYSFQIEMALRVHDAGLPIIEVPIEFREREAGRSKMSRNVVVEAMTRVTRWGARRRWETLKSGPRGKRSAGAELAADRAAQPTRTLD